MNKNLEKIESGQKLLAIIIHKGFGKEGIDFVTKPEDPFQIGVLNHKTGYVVKPHIHNKVLKENSSNQEFIFVISGEMEAKFYDDNKLVKTTILKEGDALLQVEGGHGFRILKPTKLIEVKQGPFYGIEKEKTYVEI